MHDTRKKKTMLCKNPITFGNCKVVLMKKEAGKELTNKLAYLNLGLICDTWKYNIDGYLPMKHEPWPYWEAKQNLEKDTKETHVDLVLLPFV